MKHGMTNFYIIVRGIEKHFLNDKSSDQRQTKRLRFATDIDDDPNDLDAKYISHYLKESFLNQVFRR